MTDVRTRSFPTPDPVARAKSPYVHSKKETSVHGEHFRVSWSSDGGNRRRWRCRFASLHYLLKQYAINIWQNTLAPSRRRSPPLFDITARREPIVEISTHSTISIPPDTEREILVYIFRGRRFPEGDVSRRRPRVDFLIRPLSRWCLHWVNLLLAGAFTVTSSKLSTCLPTRWYKHN